MRIYSRTVRPVAVTAVGTAVAAVLAGCGDGDAEPRPIEGPAKEVAGVIERFERATADHDFATICTDLFTAAVRRRAGGERCAAVLAERGRRVERPRIVIERIEIRDRAATVRVTTTAGGQARVRDTIRLVREGGRYRIAALAP